MNRAYVIGLFAFVLVATLGLARADEFKRPLEHAKVGQWVRYKMANNMELKASVVKVEGKKITLKNEMWINGSPLPANESSIDLEKKPEGPAREEKLEDAVLEVNGVKLKCKVSTTNNVKSWFCEDVPIHGVVRTEMDGKPTMELVAWGDKPEDDKGPVTGKKK